MNEPRRHHHPKGKMRANAIYIWSYRYKSVENANRVDRKQTSDFQKSRGGAISSTTTQSR